MNSSTPENPYQVLLGTSFTLFLGLLFSLPLAFTGIALYLSATGVVLPLQISPTASRWELRLSPERSASDEHERLELELEAAFPAAAFDLVEREDETWLMVHVQDDAVFYQAQELVKARGYGSGSLRSPSLFDLFHSRSLEASLAWFGEHPAAVMLATSSQSLSFAVLGLVLIYLANRRGFAWTTAPASLPRRVIEGIVGGLILVVATYLVRGIAEAVGQPVLEKPWVGKILQGDGGSVWILWLLVVGLAPVAEELFFRGYLFQSLDVRLSTPLALAVSTAYFAGVHGSSSGLFVYLVLGVGLAYLHWRTRSLLAPILAHVVVSAFGLVLN